MDTAERFSNRDLHDRGVDNNGRLNHSDGKKNGLLGLSKAEIRKSNKPIMEKKRRARINHCLEELKKILLENVNKDSTQHSKLEKADILEMTVKHLQQVRNRQVILGASLDHSVLEKFRTGYAECATEVQSYINQIDDLEPDLKARLFNHLDTSVSRVKRVTPFNFAQLIDPPKTTQWNGNLLQIPMPDTLSQTPGSMDDLNNNQRMHLDLVPTRLSTGELAFVMPNSSNISFNGASTSSSSSAATSSSRVLNNTSTPRFSAFSVVGNKSRVLSSPPLSPISGDERSDSHRSMESPMSVYHSTLGNSSLGNITSFGAASFASTSRLDSGYKSDLNMTDLIQKPTVPQQSYTDLFKTAASSSLVLSGPKSSTSTVSIGCSSSNDSNSSDNDQKQSKDDMWRPW